MTGAIEPKETSVGSLADNLVDQMFRAREEREPYADPGDLTITVQDDMPLAEVAQRGQTIGRGRTLLAALSDAVDNVEKGKAYDWVGRMTDLSEIGQR